MAEAPDLRRDSALRRERIVGGDGAVGIEPKQLAGVGCHVLRRREFLPLARADEEMAAVRREGDPVAVMAAPGHLRHLPPDHCEAVEPRSAALRDQPAAPDRCAARAALAGLDEAEVDEAVLGELGVKHDVAEPALAAIIDRRNAGDVDRGGALQGQQFQPPRFLGDKRLPTPRQEGHRPGLGELRHRVGAERPILRLGRRARAAGGGGEDEQGGNEGGAEQAHKMPPMSPRRLFKGGPGAVKPRVGSGRRGG